MNIKKILISQNTPSNIAPYAAITEKYGVSVDFRPFFLIEPLTSREFRAQRVNIAEYTAIVFSSRPAIDAFFALCEELRVKVPETLKYFCTTEIVAMYLQKHIVYRKRKIFFGDGTPASIVAQIGNKHAGEKFLITTSEGSNTAVINSLFEQKGLDFTTAVFVKSVPQDLSDIDIHNYDLVLLYNQNDVKSLMSNFPGFESGNTLFAAYGKGIVKAMQEAGLEPVFQAPSPEAPSAAKAIELYLQNNS